MLQTNPAPVPKPVRPPIPHVDLAKWPPDDDMPGSPALPGIPAGGGFGGYGGGDGDVKTGRFKPAAILVGIIAVLGFAAFMLLGAKKDAERLTIEQGEEKKKNIFVLPK